jgi:N-acetylmuramoyl-L-alanine amidase
MTNQKFILVMLLFFAILVFANITTFGEEYSQYQVFADSDFTHWHDVCIDPGHGGPEAQKYGNNGDNAGAYGYQDSLSEQWINLQVAYNLRDSLYIWGNCPGLIVMGVIMTREGWRDIAGDHLLDYGGGLR